MTTIEASIRRVDLGSTHWVQIGTKEEVMTACTSDAFDLIRAIGEVEQTYVSHDGRLMRFQITPKEGTENKYLPTRKERRADAMNWAGARMASFARSTGSLVVLVKSSEQGINSFEGLPWSLICEDHGQTMGFEQRMTAESFMSTPEDWCEICASQHDH